MSWPAWTRPVVTDTVTRDDVRIAYAVHGSGPATVVLLPTWSIIRSRFWKAQVPYLARHYRVVTFDGRGSGASDRPVGAAACANTEFVADLFAVLDAAGVDRAVLVGLSAGATWALMAAAARPGRVQGVVTIGAAYGSWQPHRHAGFAYWADPPEQTPQGWLLYNRHVWTGGGYSDFVDFFFGQMFSEPHSTKQREDCVGWAHEIAPGTLVDATAGRIGLLGATSTHLDEYLGGVRCPTLLIHGSQDAVRPADNSRELARRIEAELVVLDGAGHGPMSREPVKVNHLLREFVDRVTATDPGQPPQRRRRAGRRPSALFVSSPIGLGHATRDLAIARELRQARPDVKITWLAQDPVTRVLASAGERVHPASRHLASESAHIEAECGEHDLAVFESIRRMDDILVSNYLVLDEILDTERIDLVVGDEAWETDYHLHENPERKRSAFAWLTDFVGWLPMPEGGDREARLTADYNAEMIEHRARLPWVRDRSVFVGDPEDVVLDSFGPGLPRIRDWVQQEFDFAGYVGRPARLSEGQRARVREDLGLRLDERLVVVTVGGSAVGAALLRRIQQTVPLARRARPELRFLVVAGPRIDPASLPPQPGAEVVGYLPDLWRVLAAADAAIVQGGLTTCMELAAAGTPFLYVPLRRHFEQQIHVPHRLQRYRAGTRLDYERLGEPDALEAALLATLDEPVRSLPVGADGAACAAALLAELV